MKAITLTQPWATLVAIGVKQTETRSWSTKYRGPLAIHAAKGWTRAVVSFAMHPPCRGVLADAGYTLFSQLPRGEIIATCTFVDCIPTERFKVNDFLDSAFGDFTTGRFAWVLSDVRKLDTPIPARGSLGLWNWEHIDDTPQPAQLPLIEEIRS